MKRTLGVSGLVLAGLLSACGGGGGGDDDAPDGPYDVAAAWQNAVATPYTYTATGQVDGATLSVTVTNGTPAGPANYPRDPNSLNYWGVDQSITVSGGGTTETITGRTYFLYASGSVNLIGVSYSDGTCGDITSNLPLPTTATIGQSGPLYTETEYDSCSITDANLVGTAPLTWSLRDYSGVPYFCVVSQDAVESFTQCIQVSANGSLGPRVRWVIKLEGLEDIVLTGG